MAVTVSTFTLVYLFAIYRSEVPNFRSIDDYEPMVTTKVFAAGGELIGEFAKERRTVVSFDELPSHLIQAFIAAEDQNFREHEGIDFLGIGNAILEKLLGQRDKLRGASTITQQLAKSLLIEEVGFAEGSRRSFRRKFKEAILARRLEALLSKEEIIWMYLNQVYLGHGAYGVQSAAESYFNKHVRELTVSEAALLAGLPKAPSWFSPLVNPSAAKQRQKYVLGRMYEEGSISENEMHEAKEQSIVSILNPRENLADNIAPYFTEHVRRYIYETYGEASLYELGLRVETTLDLNRDTHGQIAMKTGLTHVDHRQGFLGPVMHIAPEKESIFLQTMDEIILDERSGGPGGQYLAYISEIDPKRQVAKLKIGTERVGLLPLAAMGWARQVDATKIWYRHLPDQIEKVLVVGDVVWVKRQTKDEILNRTSHPLAKRALTTHEFNEPLYSLEQEPAVEGALISIAPKTNYIETMVGGFDHQRSEFNRAVQACRQPGSAFKPITYATAIAEKDYTAASLVLDAPLTFRWDESGSSWKPKNFEAVYLGEVTLREALMNSMNIPTLNISRDVGVLNIIEMAKKLGINSKMKNELGTAIGSSCVTPYELASVYATLARLGEKEEPIFIKRVLDRQGEILEDNRSYLDPTLERGSRLSRFFEQLSLEDKQVIEKSNAYIINYLMTQVVNEGTGQRAKKLNRVIAGKTGTTNDSYDTWFVGYTPSLVSIVWVGYDSMKIPLAKYEQGARTALPIWLSHMENALSNQPREDWEVPSDICFANIDRKKGYWVQDSGPDTFSAPFKCGTEPDPIIVANPPSLLEATNEIGRL